ncbi:metallo-beta-lactamase superfamily protein [Pseudonocardia cypriaca]|uniref:Metallo-beta-lactamase superfamily protein n=1 Tax=Pseudonocardia cypriaca TaxID=882449 RepID=A0A543FYQ3_9PSEU|nr:metallo-beta-lactamase superfamily protein [Pseudonocardia cypriaca]
MDHAPDLRMLRFPVGQAYALRDGRDVTLVDTRPPGSADTPGSIALRHDERGILFTGDTAAEREGAVFLGPFNTDRDRAEESFRRLAEPGLATVCFGHGEPLLDDRTGLLGAAAGEAVVPDPLG